MYIAIDIETTGRDPLKHQVLEIGLVIDQPKPILECPTFEALVHHDEIVGEPAAFAMNHKLLKRIANGEGEQPHNIMHRLTSWLAAYSLAPYKPLGKNVGSFDIKFLERLPVWPSQLIHYRCLDVGSLYATPDGMRSLEELRVAAGIFITGEQHTAVHDARVALALARKKWGSYDRRTTATA